LLLFPSLPISWAWLASCGFRPPPVGASPFLSTATKRDEKMPPTHPAISCASRPVRGLADASIRAANAGHPWPAPAGLIRPGLRCSGGTKGGTCTARRLSPASRKLGVAQRAVGQAPFTRWETYRRYSSPHYKSACHQLPAVQTLATRPAHFTPSPRQRRHLNLRRNALLQRRDV